MCIRDRVRSACARSESIFAIDMLGSSCCWIAIASCLTECPHSGYKAYTISKSLLPDTFTFVNVKSSVTVNVPPDFFVDDLSFGFPFCFGLRVTRFVSSNTKDSSVCNKSSSRSNNVSNVVHILVDNSSIFVENWAQLKFAIHTEKKQYMLALEVAQNLVRIKPKNKAYIEQMAGVYNIIKFEEESLASLEFKLQQDLLKKSSEYVNLANFYLFKGLPIDSSKVIKKGLALGVLDNNIKHNELLSNAYIIAKDFDNAVNSLINVTKLSDDAKYDYRIGQIYLQNSDYKNAIKFLKIARSKNWDGKAGSLEMLIGISYIELDDFKNARIELAKAIALGKEDEAESWISYMDSTDSLRAAAAAN